VALYSGAEYVGRLGASLEPRYEYPAIFVTTLGHLGVSAIFDTAHFLLPHHIPTPTLATATSITYCTTFMRATSEGLSNYRVCALPSSQEASTILLVLYQQYPKHT
jgi:hypothetical protein